MSWGGVLGEKITEIFNIRWREYFLSILLIHLKRVENSTAFFQGPFFIYFTKKLIFTCLTRIIRCLFFNVYVKLCEKLFSWQLFEVMTNYRVVASNLFEKGRDKGRS